MNNLRLLTVALAATLSSMYAGVYSQTVTTLDEIFEIAEKNSSHLRPAFAAESIAEQEISIANSARLPEITASLSVSYIGDGFTTKRNFSDYQRAPIPHLGTGLGLNVNQPVYTGGAITNSVDLAKLKSTAARLATDMQRDNIRFQLTGFYMDLYKYYNLRGVVESNISSAQQVLAEMNSRYEQGTVLRNDITRYELLLSNLELQLIKINNTIRILNTNLVTIAGMDQDYIVMPDTAILQASLPVHGQDWWIQPAQSNSPSLRLARNNVELSHKAEALVKADRMPKIGIQAGWTIDGPILVEIPPINRNLSYWYVGVGVSYNISSLYKTNKALTRSKLASAKAVDDLEAIRDDLDMNLRADHVRYLEAYEELKTQEKSVELAVLNYSTTSTRYSEGMALLTDMLDAADSKLDAQCRLVNAQIEIIYQYYKLLFTSGLI